MYRTKTKYVTITSVSGQAVTIRKNKPAKCSAVKRLCLNCRKHIHKNDNRYEVKRCRDCYSILEPHVNNLAK